MENNMKRSDLKVLIKIIKQEIQNKNILVDLIKQFNRKQIDTTLQLSVQLIRQLDGSQSQWFIKNLNDLLVRSLQFDEKLPFDKQILDKIKQVVNINDMDIPENRMKDVMNNLKQQKNIRKTKIKKSELKTIVNIIKQELLKQKKSIIH